MAKTKYILSVDGGGIRGIIPAMILTEIEKRTNKRITDIFHLMAGTSTGGLVVAGLCKKSNPQYSANDLVELYKLHGQKIFKKSDSDCSSIKDGAQYSHKYLEKVLDKYFGESTFADTSSKLLLTSYDIYNNDPCIFKCWNEDMRNIMLKDALRATTAAPTYFVPKQLTVNQTNRVLVDGGLFANNPAACAYASATKLFPNDKIVLLSIGTGRTDMTITLEEAKQFRKMEWIRPLIHIMFSSSKDIVNYQLATILQSNFIKIDSHLTEAKYEIDNVSEKNMKALQRDAWAMINYHNELIDKFCSSIC